MRFNGSLLRKIRKEAGHTQANFAKVIDISRETVINIEKQKEPSLLALQLEVVNRWWRACKDDISESTRKEFKAHLLEFFNM